MSADDCVPIGGHADLVVARWPEELHDRIERVVLAERLLVLSTSCKTVSLLDRCQLDGDYRYLGALPETSDIHFETSAELQVNTGTTSSDTSDATRLAMLRVGQLTTTRQRVLTADLVGECSGATHFVRAVSVGASTSTRSELPSSCQRLSPGTDVPPAECRRFLRLQLTPIRETPGDEPSVQVCPAGWSWSGTHCQERPAAVEPHDCLEQRSRCEWSCAGGDLVACTRLGSVLAGPQKNGTEEMAPSLLPYVVGCRGGEVRTCYRLGRLSLLASMPTRVRAPAEEPLRRSCDRGFAAACSQLGVLRATSTGSGAARAPALDALLRGCAGGDAAGCAGAVRLTPAPGLPAEFALALLARGCDGNDVRSCTEAAALSLATGGRDARTRALMRKACNAGQAAACERR
jgi:hypothetical protein